MQYLKINVLPWKYLHLAQLFGQTVYVCFDCICWRITCSSIEDSERTFMPLPCKFRIITVGHFIITVSCYAHFIIHIAMTSSFCKTRMFDSAFERGEAIFSVLWEIKHWNTEQCKLARGLDQCQANGLSLHPLQYRTFILCDGTLHIQTDRKCHSFKCLTIVSFGFLY